MTKKLIAILTSILILSTIMINSFSSAFIIDAQSISSRQVEDLDRGLVAIKTSSGVYLSWRYLAVDSENIQFDIYKDGKKINTQPIVDSTNYLDSKGSSDSSYYIVALENNKIIDTTDTIYPLSKNYFDIPISAPEDGVTPTGDSYTYTANDASVSDLDGDGQYEIILKWNPSNAKDNAYSGYTGNVYLDAYKLDGTLLWRIDLGVNIRAGSHYTQFMVYDFDGDGYGELVCKTADGTKDGLDNYIGDSHADYRNTSGRILSGPEYLTLFDGRTGEAIHTIDYEPGRGNIKDWGDSYGNRVDRFLGAVAYLNGETPSVVMCRGYYSRSVLVAYDVINKKLVKRWTFDSNESGNSAYAGQGNHNLAVADVDNDGYDEIVYGACTIDHDGTGLYSLGLGHGDAIHVGDFLPDRDGLEVWGCFESGQYGDALWDAATGEIILRHTASGDTGRALAGNFIPGNSSAEFVSSANNKSLYDGDGNILTSWSSFIKWSINFSIYWNGDLEQEVLDRQIIEGYPGKRYLTGSGVKYINSTKSNSSLCADILGDWREEVIFPTYDDSALRVYITTASTSYRIATLMHDTQYRCQIASQNVGYNMPAHTSFFLGTGYDLPENPLVYTAKSKK